MSDPTIDRLLAKREQQESRARSLREAADATNRDVTDDELTIIRECNAEVEKIDKQLDVLTHDLAMPDTIRDRIARVSSLNRAAPTPYRSVGEVVWDAIHADHDDTARHRYTAALQRAASGDGTISFGRGPLTRAAQHMGTLAADTTPVAGDLGGLTVSTLGPVINPYPNRMPLAAALGLTPATAGSFERPYIVDANFPDGVDLQGLQKAELASEKFNADTDALKLATYGGYLNVSAQLQRWVPGSLDVIIDQLNRRRSAKIEAALFDELNNSTGHVVLAADADAAAVNAAIYEAAGMVGEATGEAPTIIAMGWQGWARLGGLTDLANRPVMPYIGAANAMGSMSAASINMTGPAGLTPVVTPAITDDTFWVLNGVAIEGYVYYYGVLEAVEPSVLGRQVAVAADFVAYRPTPFANAAVHLSPTP